MAAISLVGVALFVLQIGVGYAVYRFLAGAGRAPVMVAGATVAVAGVAVLFAFGVVETLVLDVAVLLLSAFVGARYERRPAPR